MSGAGSPLPYSSDFEVVEAGRAEDQQTGEIVGQARERADLIAYLGRRMINAAQLVSRTSETDSEFALYRDRVRQLEVMVDEIGHGLHLGEVDVQAQLERST